MESRGAGYIPTLDGWRAVAILLVLFEHGSFCTFRKVGWTQLGGHGVEIFFVISGYLITGKLLEEDSPLRASLRKFYTRRVFRIFPVLFAYLLAAALTGLVFHRIPITWSELAASALFVRNYLNFPAMSSTGAGWFTGHLWSLSIEEQFYLLWPVVLLTVGKKTARRQLLAAFLLFALGCFVLGVVLLGRSLHLGGWHWLPNVKFAGLVFGCMLRISFSQPRSSAFLRRVFSGCSLPAVLILAAYVSTFHARVTLVDPVFCAIALCSTLVEPRAFVGRMLEWSALRWIGRLSYSLYVWQQIFLGFGTTYRPFGVFSAFPLNLTSLLLVACISYYGMEKPLMRLGHRLTRAPAAATYPVHMHAHVA